MAQHTVRTVRRRTASAARSPEGIHADERTPAEQVRPFWYRGNRRRPVDAELRDQVTSALLIAGTLIGCALLSAYHSSYAAGIIRTVYAFLVG